MADHSEDESHVVSRRELLKRVGIAGAVATVPVDLFGQATAPARTPLETLTAEEAATLDAVVARLIPTDANGPGATEARAARYIDRALGGALASSLPTYRLGLAAVDTYARTSRAAAFTQLSAPNQDAVLSDMERNAATGFSNAAGFFNMVLAHTIQGTFGDPFYGGNADFVGWDLIGYPGVRLIATVNDQRLDTTPAATHMSAYDYTMFSKKKPARAGRSVGPVDRPGDPGEPHHGG
jgi:gluconate 2-dehydrogenase gamma chain